MPDLSAILAVVREWIAKAENDFKAAVQLLSIGKEAPADSICFHCQQCVEKYFKAVLVLRSTEFPKTHNLRILRQLLPRAWRPKIARGVADRLTKYATVIRYPGPDADVTFAEARRAAGRRIRKQLRRFLLQATK